MKKIITLITLLNFVSCATMFNSGKQDVSISTPESKPVKIKIVDSNGEFSTIAPTKVGVKPMILDRPEVQVIDKCYVATRTYIDRGITGAFWLNIFNFFMFAGVDALTGAMWNLDDNVNLALDKTDACK